MMAFWKRLDNLLSSNEIVIDRLKGSAHPKFPECIYPLNYGYLKGTSSIDGNEIDVWRGSMPDPLLVAIVCTVDSLKSDSEIKLLVGCTENEINIINEFHNESDYMSGIVIMRDSNLR